MKPIRLISWFLGVSIFMTGFLKFFNPFKEWYAVQISASELGGTAYAMGIAGEMFIGAVFILVLAFWHKIPFNGALYTLIGASVILIVMMVVAVYVHLHPATPAEVLPLQIKPPFIPGFYIALALVNVILAAKQFKRSDIPKSELA